MASYSSNLARESSDSYGSLFEPDVMLPSQFFGDGDSGLEGGERKLMAALLSDGVEAYINQSMLVADNARVKNTDALEWIETEDYSYVFSFDNVCQCLGINPEYLRLGLDRYVRAINERRENGEITRKSAWKKIRRPRKK